MKRHLPRHTRLFRIVAICLCQPVSPKLDSLITEDKVYEFTFRHTFG